MNILFVKSYLMRRTFFLKRRVRPNFLVSLLLFLSCAEDSPSDSVLSLSYLSVDQSIVRFEYDSSQEAIIVDAGEDYTISVSASWIYAIPSIDKRKINVYVTVNTGAPRTGSVTIALKNLERKITVMQEENPFRFCPDNNHPHAIDLGLSVMWACCNVGASSPIEYGGYYAWGETSAKAIYNWETYKNGYYNDDEDYSHLVDVGNDISGTSYDAAHANWGIPWRMPTLNERQSLYHCSEEWISVNGLEGLKFTGPNGVCIFLPAAGYAGTDHVIGRGNVGYYWSSTLAEEKLDCAYIIGCKEEMTNYSYTYYYYMDRYYGLPIRPVCK